MNHNRRVTHTSNHVGFGGFSVDVSRFALAGNRPTDDGARENGVQEESRTGEWERAGEREGAREGEVGHGEDGNGEEAAGGRLQGNFP